MKIIVGLGNPGKTYQNTRHNVGFILVDAFFSDFIEDKKYNAHISTTSSLFDSSVLGIKPQTFMNLSGDTLSSIVSYYKLDPKTDILVISDDIDMEFAKVRFRPSGSHGGQNGLRDIMLKLGTNEFARIKIGIGRDDRYSVSDWVLSKFTPDEKTRIQGEVKDTVQEYIIKWLGDSINT